MTDAIYTAFATAFSPAAIAAGGVAAGMTLVNLDTAMIENRIAGMVTPLLGGSPVLGNAAAAFVVAYGMSVIGETIAHSLVLPVRTPKHKRR